MSWEAQVRRMASFRGVEFEVDDAGLAAGRRTARHEATQSEAAPYVEDMGRRTREYRVVGFVAGDDYLAQRDRLIAAIETAGPGTLVHPYYGTLRVVVEDWDVSESTASGGVATFNLSCVETGPLQFPTIVADTAELTIDLADQARLNAIEDAVTQIQLAGRPAWEATAAVEEYRARLAELRDVLTRPAATLAADLEAQADALAELDEALEATVTEAAAILKNPEALAERFEAALASVASLNLYRLLVAGSGLVTGDGPADGTNRLFYRIALSAAAESAAAERWTVYDDAVAARDELAEAFDAEAALAEGTMFEALRDLRAGLVEHITDRAVNLRRLRTLETSAVEPVIAIAHRLYGDAERADEVLERNRIPHPLFVGVRPLQVLST